MKDDVVGSPTLSQTPHAIGFRELDIISNILNFKEELPEFNVKIFLIFKCICHPCSVTRSLDGMAIPWYHRYVHWLHLTETNGLVLNSIQVGTCNESYHVQVESDPIPCKDLDTI